MSAKEFFEEIARPLCERFQSDPTKDLLWAAVVSVHHVADHLAVETHPTDRPAQESGVRRLRGSEPSLGQLAAIAEALKHGKKIVKKTIERAAFAQMRDDDYLSTPDVLGEPNILAAWVIDVDGAPVSIRVRLKDAVDYWRGQL
jgi:hypothetical protein